MPEDTKKSGCGCGGCLLFVFYSLILIFSGMYLSNLIAHNWDFNKAKDVLFDNTAELGSFLKNKATELITGEDAADSVKDISAAQRREYDDLRLLGDNSYNNARELLQKARNVSGEERQEILREAQKEFQVALKKYKEAATMVNHSEEALENKISHVTGLLNQMNPEN